MHSNYSPANPSLSNNPFIDDPQTRFPDISPSQQYPAQSPQPQQPYLQPQYPPQQQFYQHQQFVPQQHQQNLSGSYGQLNAQPTGSPSFQPSSSFGQQLVSQVTGAYPYSQQQQIVPGFYPQQQQQQQQPPSYNDVSQFDPYSSAGALAQGSYSQTPQGQAPLSPTGQPHPREYIHTHKAELEAWDAYSWKQLLNALEALRDAWTVRQRDLQSALSQGYGPYGAGGVDGTRLNALAREAQSHVDGVSASAFQLREVLTGYRQSGDQASKRRVRESCNAALQGLPDWPA